MWVILLVIEFVAVHNSGKSLVAQITVLVWISLDSKCAVADYFWESRIGLLS